jgi:hypothetical protein
LQSNCHKLVVLAAGGHMVFYGSPKEACDTFKVKNVTEVLPAVKSLSPNEIAARSSDASLKADISPPGNDSDPALPTTTMPRATRHLADFITLVTRQLAVLVSSPLSTLMSVFICLAIGVLLSISYPNMALPVKPQEPAKVKASPFNKAGKAKIDQYKKDMEKFKNDVDKYKENLETNGRDSNSVVFILTVSSFFLGCLAGTRELVMERRLFWRESGTEMSVWSYLGSKLLVHSILTSTQVICLSAGVVLWIHAECSPFGVAVASVVASIGGLCTGFLISAGSRSEAVATKLMLLAVLPQMILSGGLNPNPQRVVKLLSQLFITSHYSFQNMCGLFPKEIRDELAKPQYSMSVVIAMGLLHSSIMLGATVFFLRRTANGEDPSRGE